MYAFYNREKQCYMYMTVYIGVVPHTDDSEIEYSFSECGDIVYTSDDRSVLERILTLRDGTHDKSHKFWYGSLSTPFYFKELVGYEIIKIGEIIVPEEQYTVAYIESTGYEVLNRMFSGSLEQCKNLMDNDIRILQNNGVLKGIHVLVDNEVQKSGLFDVLKFFLEK